jgi:CheY-like chemotaxis protein
MRILIAEDDPIAQKVLRLTLQNFGHEVLTTGDGAAAWKLLESEPVPVVVSDWMMPNLDGLSLCQKIRRQAKGQYTYFILLTALSGKDYYQQAMAAGVDDFLTKPLRQDELLMRLRVAERILSFMRQVRDLKRLLPICSYCKRIRDDRDYWHQIETYLHTQSGTDFSHGICPDCFGKHIKPQLDQLRQRHAPRACPAPANPEPDPAPPPQPAESSA